MSYETLATIYPDRLTIRTQKKEDVYSRWAKQLDKKFSSTIVAKKVIPASSLGNLSIKKTTWQMSSTSKRKISDSFALIDKLSTPKTIFQKNGKNIYNFRCAFVTLTLPTPQSHSDTEIKSKCLNQFLTIMRQRFGLRNYVWKAELQKNDSIHFHIVWDLYIHHQAVRYYWNQALELLGYVSDYQKKFNTMSLQDYATYRNLSVPDAVNAFRAGRDTSWKSPPTEQVVAVKSSKQLAVYLRKYITKDLVSNDLTAPTITAEESIQELARIQAFGRVWARSSSISKVKFITRYDWDNLLNYLKTLGDTNDNFHKVQYDYCEVWYFNFKSISKKMSYWLDKKMFELGITYGFTPSG